MHPPFAWLLVGDCLGQNVTPLCLADQILPLANPMPLCMLTRACACAGDVGWACGVVAALLGRKAFEQLAGDEDDLYYEKGQVTSELLQYLVGAAVHVVPSA